MKRQGSDVRQDFSAEPDAAKNRNLAAHQKDEEGNSRPQDLLTEGDPGSGHSGGHV